jgi:hypothetical protein
MYSGTLCPKFSVTTIMNLESLGCWNKDKDVRQALSRFPVTKGVKEQKQ